jgi:uncharacterized Zn finger protein (UPF0148 family)
MGCKMTCPDCGSPHVEYTYGEIVVCLECGYTNESCFFQIREQKRDRKDKAKRYNEQESED